MLIALSIIVAFAIGVAIFMQTARFGKHPEGERLARVQQSPNYKDGEFKNLATTPMLAEGASYWKMTIEFFTKKVKEPKGELPSKKTNLQALDSAENVLIWMGHSTYFMQIDGKKLLVDPVMSGNASPVTFTTKAFKGTDIYTYDDIPEIDYLIITHDHWDHLDYNTVTALQPKIKKVICPLGNGSHFEYWGYESEKILEEDWFQTIQLEEGFQIHVTPSRHFSGRGFKGKQTLWASYALNTPSANIFMVNISRILATNTALSIWPYWKTDSTTQHGNTYTCFLANN